MFRRAAIVVTVVTVFALPLSAAVEFNRDVRPILSDRCYSCHGPDSSSRKSPLRLDQEESARAKSAEIVRRITSDNQALRMPPAYLGHDRLPDRDIETLRQWIAEGMRYEKHWSFLPPVRAPLPAVSDRAWPRNAIDHYLLARLEKDGFTHAPEADRAALLRRVTLDLTGLPPSLDEIAAFEKDGDYEKLVDRLLASPRYGERMAIRWLEAARYADTNGYQSDGPRDMWRWRDWVIDAFNSNMPFDRFTIEQIAGDLMPNATLSQKIATGFNRNHRTSAEGGIVDEEFRVEYVADRAETTSTVWLGLTVGCARCHDHKYDPITQKDFYSLFAFFNNVPEKGFVYNFGNEEPYIQAPLPEQQKKLDEYDRSIAAIETRLRGLEPESQRAEREWEASLRGRDLDWTITEGLTYRDEKSRHFDGKSFATAAGKDTAKFDYRDPFTFAARIRPESGKGAILSRAEDYFEGQGHGLYLIDGKIRLHVIFRWTDLGMRVETQDPVELNQWQDVLVTYDGSMHASGVHIYVDGRERRLKILFDQCIWPIDTKEPFRIGAGGGLRFAGDIADVRVYRRAVSAAEAAAIALRESVSRIAAIPASERSQAERDKLHFCFLDRYAPESVRGARAELAVARAERDRYSATLPTVMVMAERPDRRRTYLLKRGAYDAPGDEVFPRTPAVLPALHKDWSDNRLGLARWLVDRENPLTARVAVNRFWQMLFGTGLVKTVEDFGSQGEWPMHQQLLDWLAVEFMESGWDVKHILKTMVMSAAYRQSSRVTPELLEKDPENRLLARGPRFRLPPEMIRDQALAWSGLLVEKIGGPSVKPYQPAGLWQELQNGKGYEPDKGDGLYRRSLYTYWRRTVAPPSMINFDSPTRETCVVRESRTNTPMQALTLMNDPIYLEASRKLAERLLARPPEERIPLAVRIVLARAPRGSELQALNAARQKFAAYYEAHPDAAAEFLKQGDSARDPRYQVTDAATWTAVASLLINTDEAVTKE
jgi:hypothetical protein